MERGVSCKLPDAAMATSACVRRRAPADMVKSNGGVTADRAGAGEAERRGAAARGPAGGRWVGELVGRLPRG